MVRHRNATRVPPDIDTGAHAGRSFTSSPPLTSEFVPEASRMLSLPEARAQVRAVGDEARRGIESYLWTQTVISALITVLTYCSLLVLGVKNALFLSALIFVLNYIPTVGSIVAAMVPPLFALVQPSMPAWVPGMPPQDTYIYAGLVLAVVSFWQFSIGNFIQPRMMGESLNLSSLVVLLALAAAVSAVMPM